MLKDQSIPLNKLRYCHLNDAVLPEDPVDWLLSLKGPMVIDQNGRDTSCCRVVVTLVHGNEPSGFIAVHRWLTGHLQPATNVRFILCSVEAAQQSPFFSIRFVDNKADLNRCFGLATESLAVTHRAQNILTAIGYVKPEAVIDMHNTSGASPAFCVATHKGLEQQALASFFCDSLFYTRLKLGSLMEQDFGCPVVTIECGGSEQQISHQLAYQGLSEFLQAHSVFEGRHFELGQILEHPLRIELAPGISVTYASQADPAYDLTLVSDIEQHNMGVSRADSLLGWGREQKDLFCIKNEAGQTIESDVLYLKDGAIYTRYPLRIFMATSNARIAQHDCLMYVFVQSR